jgi:hypothetical protein
MLTYNTELQAQPPISQQELSRAMSGLKIRSPYGYSPQHQDVLNALGDENAANYQLNADKANSAFGVQKLQAQRDLALQGLQQMAQAQQQQSDLANTRTGMGLNFASSLLSGLFR